MNKKFGSVYLLLFMSCFLTGCNVIGQKNTSISAIYAVVTIISLLLLMTYGLVIREKDIWFLLLSVSIVVVNIGYFALSISKTLEEALLANRISYLGSVFLPMAMFMIIVNSCKLKCPKWVQVVLGCISIFVFLVAASPGYLDIYYKDVTLERMEGVSVLNKTYGEWHVLYLLYLITYFGVMVLTIIKATVQKKVKSNLHAIILAGAVWVNIGVWLLEQLVEIQFELLSISYIISLFFMLCLYMMVQLYENTMEKQGTVESPVVSEKENNKLEEHSQEEGNPTKEVTCAKMEVLNEENFDQNPDGNQVSSSFIQNLTPTEKVVFNFYLEGKTSKEIMMLLTITENTLKYHNKNIYSKLGVSSRKQLLELARNQK